MITCYCSTISTSIYIYIIYELFLHFPFSHITWDSYQRLDSHVKMCDLSAPLLTFHLSENKRKASLSLSLSLPIIIIMMNHFRTPTIIWLLSDKLFPLTQQPIQSSSFTICQSLVFSVQIFAISFHSLLTSYSPTCFALNVRQLYLESSKTHSPLCALVETFERRKHPPT